MGRERETTISLGALKTKLLVTYMVSVDDVAQMGKVTERVQVGIPPKRHDDPSSSSWKVPQKDDYPVRKCPPPDEQLEHKAFPKQRQRFKFHVSAILSL